MVEGGAYPSECINFNLSTIFTLIDKESNYARYEEYPREEDYERAVCCQMTLQKDTSYI